MGMDKRSSVMTTLVLVVIVAATALVIIQNDDNNDSDINWKGITLKDVSTDEEYTIEELEKPLLLETFAVWCPTCTRQQEEVQKFHDNSDVTSVSLDVDPNEDEEKIEEHLNRHGFDWRYSVAPAEMTGQLVQEFGNSITTPPRAPMVLVCEDGTRRLEDGVKPASKLEQEVEEGC